MSKPYRKHFGTRHSDSYQRKTNHHQRRDSFGECAYHLCNKKHHLHRCPYCSELFCEVHREPIRPMMPNFGASTKQARSDLNEYYRSDGHPCPRFVEAENRRKEREESIVIQNFNGMPRSPHFVYQDKNRTDASTDRTPAHQASSRVSFARDESKHNRFSFNMPRQPSFMRHLRISKELQNIGISLVAAIVLSGSYYLFHIGLIKAVSALTWVIFSFFLYRRVFHYINSVDMSDDLKYWAMRIGGAIITLIGLFFAFPFLFTAVLFRYEPFTMGIAIVIGSLAVLGAFIAFRTNRRYTHIYVNR